MKTVISFSSEAMTAALVVALGLIFLEPELLTMMIG